ncbi:MAG: hypothetical protein ACR2NX_14745 [Chthoniobacterales bacterium]
MKISRTYPLGVCIVLASLSLLMIGSADGQAPHKPIIPLEPDQLLKFLPVAPAGWQLKKSTAKTFFVEWICSQATREFERIPPPNAPPAPAQSTTVTLVDTGYFPAFNGPFDGFRVGKYGAFESLMIGNMRARRSKMAADRESLQASVRGRFIVSVEVKNQPQTNEQAWLSTFNFPAINAIPDTGAETLPQPIKLKMIDELVPARNSTSTVYSGGPKSAADRKATDQ